MQISIANAIQVARRIGAAAAKVITTNLKMWLGFETSETLGREEVVNGDFATDLSNWSIADSDSTHTVTHTSNGARFKSDTTSPLLTFTSDTANIVSGRSYEIKVVISEYQGSSGIKIQNSATGSVNYLFDSVDTFTYSFTAVSNSSNPIQFYRNGANVDITIESVSLKELTQITPDKSGNNNVGELFTGKALDFDGANDYVNTTGFEMAGTSFTFAFWIYPKATTYQFIMDLDVVGTNQRSILGLFQENSDPQKFAWYNNPGGFRQFGTPTQNEWQRVVFRVSPTTVECYVNGIQSGTTQSLATAHNYSNINNSVIGGRNNFGTTQRLDGSLSDFQIYNAYWSTDDIAYDYANPQNLVTDRSGTSITLSNLKAYWAMSEGKGSTAYDSSGEGNNGTINGAIYEPAQPRIPQLGMMNWAKSTPVSDEITLIPNPNNTSQDILGNAVRDRLNSFNLDGIGYAEVADDADLDLGTGAFSFDGWAKYSFINKGSEINVIYCNGKGATESNTFSVCTVKDGNIRAYVGINQDNKIIANLSEDDWFYFAITRDGSGNVKFYSSADINNPLTFTSTRDLTNSLPKRVGQDGQTSLNRNYENLISDLRIYKNKELTSDEIENNYNAGLSAHTN